MPEDKRPHGGSLVACQPPGTLVKPFQGHPAKPPAEPRQAREPSRDSQDSSHQRKSLAHDQNDELFIKKSHYCFYPWNSGVVGYIANTNEYRRLGDDVWKTSSIASLVHIGL